MCGLSGFLSLRRRGDRDGLARIGRAMTDTLQHRGPDSDGVWVDEDAGVALCHNRLAILDLSPEGYQPMRSESGRYVIVFNGEIYNHLPLGAELAAMGCVFRGHSDTEVLLAAIEQWGLEATLARISGMFAFALWDRAERQLHIARDHIGKKPLYFGRVGDGFAFASELKALAALPGFDPAINREALSLFLRYQYVPAPHSIWRGIHKLPQGSMLSLGGEDVAGSGDLSDRIRRYWSVRQVAEAGARAPLDADPEAIVDLVEAELRNAVGERMITDVPFGAFLSGGIDSSVVTALMQQQSSQPIRTFTIGFNEAFYNESDDARAVASQLGTEHVELLVSPAEARGIIPMLPDIYDEPFADPSAVPTYHVCKLARRDVTVCLSGDGGDELFAGYGRYALANQLGREVDRFPRWIRSAVARGVEAMPVGLWDSAFRLLRPGAAPGLRGDYSGDRMHKLAVLMGVADRDELYREMLGPSRDAWLRDDGAGFAPTSPDAALRTDLSDPVQRMMYHDSIGYLPDNILTKVDRASMAVSLEVRAPLLDRRLMELSWRIPQSVMRLDGSGKWPLRALFKRLLPAEMAEKPKQGFAVPVSDWLRGPLRDWAAELLDPRRLDAEGLLDSREIGELWRQHLSGTRNFGFQLWTIAMFQAWHERWAGARKAEREPELQSA